MSEMVVVLSGGATSRAYSLRVDGRIVGSDDFLGIEDGQKAETDPVSIHGLMVAAGADREKAAKFLQEFRKAADDRRAAGGLLHQSGVFKPEDNRG